MRVKRKREPDEMEDQDYENLFKKEKFNNGEPLNKPQTDSNPTKS